MYDAVLTLWLKQCWQHTSVLLVSRTCTESRASLSPALLSQAEVGQEFEIQLGKLTRFEKMGISCHMPPCPAIELGDILSKVPCLLVSCASICIMDRTNDCLCVNCYWKIPHFTFACPLSHFAFPSVSELLLSWPTNFSHFFSSGSSQGKEE